MRKIRSESRVKKNTSEKTMQKQRKKRSSSNHDDTNSTNKRILVTVNVVGSAGPLRFVVNEDDQVGGVIDVTLKQYAREGRLPTLGSASENFLLYSANARDDPLNAWSTIGASGGRNFIMCKKVVQLSMTEASSETISKKRINGKLKAWLNKSLSLKILSH
ncbi:hypothetical protein Droror1_Dr00022555 [Drosera rotundifolia]